MVEEERVVDAKAERKAKKRKVAELEKKAYKDRLPICLMCFNRDYPDLKEDWLYYTKMKQTDEQVVKNENPNSPSFEKPIGIFRDFECTRCVGRHSMWIPKHELKVGYFRKKAKE